MAIQDYFLGKVKEEIRQPLKPQMSYQLPLSNPGYEKGLEADAAFLTPFFNMPSSTAPNMSTPKGPVYAPPPTQPKSAVTQTAKIGGMAITDPTTGQPYGDNVNPFEPTKPIADPKLAEQMQKDYQTIFGDKPPKPARMRPQLSILDGKPITNDTGGGVLQAGETVEERNARLGFGPKTDPTIEEKFGIEDTGKTEKDMFSMFGVDSTDPNSLYGKFGITQPDYNAPDSQEYKDLVAEQKKLSDIDRRDQLQKYYEADVERITADYDIKREQLGVDVDNARNERISSLYDVGVVNPLSSGLASIGTASADYHKRQEGLLKQLESSEKQKAYANYFDLDTKEIERRIKSIESAITAEQDNAKAEYQQQVDEFGRGVQLVDKLIGVWKENNRVSEAEREDAQGAFNDLVKNFGSAAFNGMDASSLAEMEAALGYPAGSLQSGITQLKKDELTDKPMDLRTIGGSLYNIERDANGNIVPTLIIAKPAGGGGGGSSVSDKDLKAMFNEADSMRKELADGKLDWGQAYNRIARQYPDFAIPDSSGKTIIDDALGGSAGYDPQTGTFDSSKASGYATSGTKNDYKLSPDQVIRYYSAAYDSEKKKVDTSKIPDNVRNEVIERYGSDVNPPKEKKW